MIRVHDLKYRYPGNEEDTLNGLDFSISRGEIFGFLGPSGAGKSTTQKILTGILKDYRGQVQVNNQEIRRTGIEYSQQIGVAFEFPNFYNRFTAMENLKFFSSLYNRKPMDPGPILERIGLAEDMNRKVSEFSKGMKVRLNFVRSLLHDPDILFLDEPTSGLDPLNARIMRDIIREQQALGKTILLTTHHMQSADELCDRVAFMVDGAIRHVDSPRNLKLNYGKKDVRVEYHHGGTLRVMEFPIEGLGDNALFLDLLKTEKLETIHTQEATLEDIFIALTGRGLQ